MLTNLVYADPLNMNDYDVVNQGEDIFDKYLQYENKIPIRIIDQSSDPIGNIFIYKIKELIRSSNSMILTVSNKIERIDVICNTMNYDDSNTATIYSIIWVYASLDNYIYLDSTYGYVGNQRLSEASENIVALIDKTIQLLKGWMINSE